MASKGPVLSLDMKKGILSGSIDNVNRLNNDLQLKITALSSKYSLCIANL
jgi:hypothetical protein